MPDDETYRRLLLQAGEFAAARETVGASDVQRHVRVGFATAMRLLEDLRSDGVIGSPDDRRRWRFLGIPCRHCGGKLVRCAGRPELPVCKGWKHAAWLSMGPIGSHYCEGRSVNPSGEPATAETEEGNG
jgi:Ftsk gamma domain